MAKAVTSSSDAISRLSFELLSKIYYDSANPALPLASPHLYLAVSAEHTRLVFSANLFDPTYEWDLDNYPRLDLAQTEAVSRAWFTHAFALNVQEEVGRRMHAGSNPRPRVTIGAKLPAHVLCGPWTEQKIQLLQLLIKWGFRAHWSRESRPCPGLNAAVEIEDPTILGILLGDNVRAAVDDAVILHSIRIRPSQARLRELIYARFGAGEIMNPRDEPVFKEMRRRCWPNEEPQGPNAEKLENSDEQDGKDPTSEYKFWKPPIDYMEYPARLPGCLGPNTGATASFLDFEDDSLGEDSVETEEEYEDEADEDEVGDEEDEENDEKEIEDPEGLQDCDENEDREDNADDDDDNNVAMQGTAVEK